VERRKSAHDGCSPMTVLEEMPALVVLERFPIPVLAITAFAEMLGETAEAVKARRFAGIFRTMPDDTSAVSVLRAHADLIVELLHHDGSIVRARMSKSALIRDNDPVALAAFQDLTEKLWIEEF
jgi:hypothetical protein